MRLTNILAIPVALVADACTLCNFGQRSFTQQVFDRARDEAALVEATRAIRALAEEIRRRNESSKGGD